MFIATVLAADALSPERLDDARDRLADLGAEPGEARWLDEGHAADVPLSRWRAEWRSGLASADCDIVVQRTDQRRRRLLVSDMDSTIITVECIDELADYAGCKAEVAAVTERAMRGELDFARSLTERVALLDSLPLTTLDECLRERVRPMAGAATLLATVRSYGLRTLLVSGGFTRFADPVGRRLGFDRVRANRLEERDGRLTGRVLAPIFDADAKVTAMKAAQNDWGINPEATLAVGDGANDLPMIRAAGLGLAYRAKPVVAAEADGALRKADLSALLWVCGIPRRDWVTGSWTA